MRDLSLLLLWGCCGLCNSHIFSTKSVTTDVNECEDTTVCPPYATCTDTVDSYYCTCKQGFVSSNGLTQFTDPGVTCKDVDECSQNPQTCGPNSICKNLLGRYKCSCLPGFSSPTGNNWTSVNLGHFSCKDMDECANPRTCPEHATCHNHPGSYSCVCNQGFESSSGKTSFQGPGETCEALCPKCPENADCFNNTQCACKDGFQSTSGKKYTEPHEKCEDIDECKTGLAKCSEIAYCRNEIGSYYCSCIPNSSFNIFAGVFKFNYKECYNVDECARNSTLCGLNSICTNSPGEYNCSCLPGFFSPVVWTPEKPEDFRCTDIDECLHMRLSNARCTNTLGSYFWTCFPGFAPSTRQLNFTGQDVECRDVDECSQDPSPCGPNSVCTNAPGSYSCSCIEGFRPNPEGSLNFSCKRVPFKCKEDVIPNNAGVQQCQVGAAGKSEYGSFCALVNATFSVLDNVCENKTTAVSLKSTVESLTSVLEQTSTWSNFTKEETSVLATVLLESVKSSTLAAFLKPSANVTQTVQTKHLEIESKIIREECTEENKTFHFKAKGNEMKVGCSTIKESGSAEITGVAFVSFTRMELFLDESFFQDPQTLLAKPWRKLKMNSHVVQGIMTGERQGGFSDPVIYTLENIEPKQPFETPICISWDTDMEGGRWIHSGCLTHEASEMYTVCSCNRMMNLAIIMASGELTMEFSLYIISHVGLIISLVCLLLAIATFLLCRAIRNHNTYLHLHLCVCLFLAKALFLAGVDKTDSQTGCAIIAGFLHYLFLACFFWMLVEAVMLFLMVRNLKVMNYFSSRNIKMWYLCVFGYGLPGLVVAVSAGVRPKGYGMRDRCWLNPEMGFAWSFLGPVCVIIMINSILLTCTLCILRQKLSSVNAEVSTLKDTRLLTFKAFAQLFILGCTWVLGIFQIGPMARVMAYLFTIINSLQGTFIFTIHCLLNRQVREEYRRCITRKTKGSSESQTSGMLLSSVPSTSKTG